MPLSIKDPETERLARDLALRTGETITETTKKALQDRLRRFRTEHEKTMLLEDLEAIRHHFASLPRFDDRSAEEILGYDEHGLPT